VPQKIWDPKGNTPIKQASVQDSRLSLLLHPMPGKARPPGTRRERYLRLLRIPVLIQMLNILTHALLPASMWSNALSWAITTLLLVFVGYEARAVEKMNLPSCLQVGFLLFVIWYLVSVVVAFPALDLPLISRERYLYVAWSLVSGAIFSLLAMLLTGLGAYVGVKRLRRSEFAA
jgi:hypothetical protein